LSYSRFKITLLGWRSNYEGRLKISWTHLIRKRDRHHTPSRNFMACPCRINAKKG